MEPRLTAGGQTTDRMELIRQGRVGDNAAALADQLVLEFLVMELTEPPAAQLAKMAGDGAQLQFISSMFDRNPILERLAASAVSQRFGTNIQRNSLHPYEDFDESTIPVECSQNLRLLYLVREVLQRRNTFCHNVHAQAKQLRQVPLTAPHKQLQQDLNSTNVMRHCENCGSNRQFIYHTNLTQNSSLGQNVRDLISQSENEHGMLKASSKMNTASIAGKEEQVVRTSKITEKLDENDVTMSVKVYIPSPPPRNWMKMTSLCLLKFTFLRHHQFSGVKCSYIGRLIGPNGITIRELQLETRCHIAVRGRGSIKDSKLFRKMRHKPGFGHLREDTHVLVEAKASTRTECRSLIEKAKKRISEMFTPEFDALKREQLIHLAMLNGTYRQSVSSSSQPS
ncbi:KH domain protein [Dictyocaulus viviparus]|uniref:KH domain protein n=1 Tax=Dictyocaulus viviparus TaxID=29172 RepID=A0A0D8Y1P7_DICVI|nr:KH domain protein [Dictyocaulus viviparus]